MCGICGIIYNDPGQHVSENLLVTMRDTLAHRGPDGSGVWIDGNVGLGHRRLSIIDIEGGRQPLSNEDGTVWVTFNGEIFNFRELKAKLEQCGHQFRTHSDTEVLVHAYEEYGADLVKHLNGMFAFAICDVPRRRVLLGRDHLGIKPFFYRYTPEGLFFGSEIKAVLAGAEHNAEIRSASLQEYLVFRYVAGANTFFEGVHRLPPAHIAIWEHGEFRTERYWEPPAPNEHGRGNVRAMSEQLDAELDRAVDMQLMSDVPLGTFCSGGLDSGLVTGLASRHQSHLLSFSVGFESAAWDETALARASAKRFGTEHHTLLMQETDFYRPLPGLVALSDEPLSHPNSVPLSLLSGLARQHVTVVLTGEGADELFGGYPRYHLARLQNAISWMPEAGRRSVAQLLRALPGHRADRIADSLPFSFADSLLFNSAYVHPSVVERLTGQPLTEALAERRRILDRSIVPGDAVASLCRYEMQTYLGCALDRMDRMSMVHGLEARVPFLDVPLVEWGMRLPSNLKLSGRENKRIVRSLAARLLPPAVANGPKSGFGVPLGDWFRAPDGGAWLELMSGSEHPALEHFDADLVRGYVREHQQGRRDHGELLWLLLNVFQWYDVHTGAGMPDLEPASVT